MDGIWLPESIRRIVAGKAYEQNRTGMSESQVYMFDEMVLKIQPFIEELENEVKICRWLDGRIPVPEVIEYAVAGGRAYSLMTRVPGRMLCDPLYLSQPRLLLELVVQAFELLWAVDPCGCPCDSSVDVKLQAAKYNVGHGLVDLDNVEPETFGEGGFASPQELLGWLQAHRPKPAGQPVLSHGDFCLPNIFAEGNRVSGFIDLGRMGTADKWQDLAIASRSLRHNFAGRYGGKTYEGFLPEKLFERLGVEEDGQRLEYYLLLDELF